MLYLDFEAQGRGSTFTFCHTHLKKAILHLTTAIVQIFFFPVLEAGAKGLQEDTTE